MRQSGESNGKLPLRTCPGCSIPESYRLPDWALDHAKPAQGLNTHYYYYYYYETITRQDEAGLHCHYSINL
jgi:hypothetical protein